MDAAEARKRRGGPTLVARMKAADPSLAVRVERLVAAADVEADTVRRAEAFFLAGLAKLLGDETAPTRGDEEFGFFVRVPVSRLHELSPQVSDLQLEVQERFGILLSAMPIPFAE